MNDFGKVDIKHYAPFSDYTSEWGINQEVWLTYPAIAVTLDNLFDCLFD